VKADDRYEKLDPKNRIEVLNKWADGVLKHFSKWPGFKQSEVKSFVETETANILAGQD
jgi:hypothetical protein